MKENGRKLIKGIASILSEIGYKIIKEETK